MSRSLLKIVKVVVCPISDCINSKMINLLDPRSRSLLEKGAKWLSMAPRLALSSYSTSNVSIAPKITQANHDEYLRVFEFRTVGRA